MLIAFPDSIRLGRVFKEICDDDLMKWLQDNVSTYADVFNDVKKLWGKRIVHQNILIARITDISLKIAFQKAFPNPVDMLFLTDEYAAFPSGLQHSVETLVAQKGFAVKIVKE